MSDNGLRLFVKAVTAAAKAAGDIAANDKRLEQTAQKVKGTVEKTILKRQTEARETVEKLNRSQVYKFVYDLRNGIVLSNCKKEHNVADLHIPDVVETIGDNAFKGCLFLESIDIPASVKKIGRYAFLGCKNLKHITFHEGLKTIEVDAFTDTGLTEALLPDGLERLGARAFYRCSQLKRVRLPESVRALDNAQFFECKQLEEITLPYTMNGNLSNVFFRCESLESICIPDGVYEIGDRAFTYCTRLKDISIPASVKKICNHAFYSCESLEYIYIPDSVEEIGIGNVFGSCASLESIRLPIGVRFIDRFGEGFDVFSGCNSLKTVILGIHRFEVDEPPDLNAFYAMHAELAADGQPTAKRFVLHELGATFDALIARNDIAAADKLLSSGIINENSVDMKDFDSIIDRAAETESSEIYVMLVQYKRDKLGFDTNDERFRL